LEIARQLNKKVSIGVDRGRQRWERMFAAQEVLSGNRFAHQNRSCAKFKVLTRHQYEERAESKMEHQDAYVDELRGLDSF
jgi:pyocin large subunit-like protein